MALSLTLLNGDSSWLIEVDGTRLLLDPWLLGDAQVVHPAVHILHLGQGPVVQLADVGRVDALMISHPFPDHCNANTLRQLPRDLPAFAPRVVRPFVKWFGGPSRVTNIPNATWGGKPVDFKTVSLSWCRASGPIDTTHNALIVRGRESGATVMYCPHGLLPDEPKTLAAVERTLAGRLDAFLCSFTLLDLPFYLGGVANLGMTAGMAMIERFSPRYVFATHDSEKPDSGFIARAAKTTRCPDLPAALAGRVGSTQVVVPETGKPWLANGAAS